MTDDLTAEARRRRTFAVISHPDAGKSTLTEAIALHASVIDEAGAVHGKAGRRGVVSDWMEMERSRGISITSAALRFEYGDHVVNLLDTPGHADFSEDTYRVLAAVDSAVMLLDAAKGLEPQTLKLFEVCRTRGLPIVTFVNKWDRPGLEPLQLLDELVERLGIHPMPLTWPVGVAGDFRGVLDVRTGELVEFARTPGGATLAGVQRLDPDTAKHRHGEVWATAVEEYELLRESGHGYDQAAFLAGAATPVMFGAAVVNFGVNDLLRVLVDLAPAPGARIDVDGQPRAVDTPFSGFVFKVQSGMDAAHRDRMAFVRVCSGRFTRGMVVTHAQSGKPFATKYAQAVFGRSRETVDHAYPGDVVGLVNAAVLRVGDSLYDEQPVTFPPIPKFAPEHFAVIRSHDPSRAKQFRRGIEQLDQEGVVQVLVSERRGAQAPVLAAVGPLQFEVVEERMRQEFSARVILERLDYSLARRVAPEVHADVDGRRGAEVLQRSDGVLVAVFTDRWRLGSIAGDLPEGSLSSLLTL
ncbi:peptide chain release factor 3 [Angustibacter sp. Root456]|uniref:peptide chain release factor 3 n=1 Tax=Angustibacter sp. Root456 TaxID=1736539 RepID=UPI0007014741|nr:peptide chain release factor 3 [Angustibacter sp. Root456]KQX61808.1 peptide chain release factor 3 [Angustibacter sp. Root456]